jgi:AraC-like DNA-binding protein
VKEARFGEVTITDCFLSPQEISRRRQHIARIDKDCIYVALMQKGHQAVEQGGQVLGCGPGEGCLFSASDPYVLRNVEPYRALYIEIPRAAMAKRVPVARLSQAVHLNTAYGMGRIVSSFCGAMVLESGTVVGPAREVLSEKLMDLLTVALDGDPIDVPVAEACVRDERLRQVKNFIEGHLGNPLLNPDRVAGANQLSVRTLHYLFKGTGQSVSDYILERRLLRCREELEAPAFSCRTVTEIALACGFNSLSHFSSAFRQHFGTSPSMARARARS